MSSLTIYTIAVFYILQATSYIYICSMQGLRVSCIRAFKHLPLPSLLGQTYDPLNTSFWFTINIENSNVHQFGKSRLQNK
jgi:hypothetical protein